MPARRARWPALALLPFLLAGCLTASQTLTPLPLPVALPVLPIVQDHDHHDARSHTGHANLDVAGYSSGYGDGSVTALPAGQGFSEEHVWTGERDGKDMTLVFLGRRNGPDGGFVILNATDPLHIQRLGAFDSAWNYDIEVSDDGRFAFTTTQSLPTQGHDPRNGEDPTSAHLVQGERGVDIVDLEDVSNPQFVDVFPILPRGAHTITYHKMPSGEELLVANAYDPVPDPSLGLPVAGVGMDPVTHRTFVTRFVRDPVPHLELLSVFQKTEQVPPSGQGYFPHDTSIAEHPLTHRTYLYVSYWDLGAYIVDLTDPANPVEVGRMTDFTPSQHAAIHFTRPAGVIDGKYVVITEPEFGPADETGQLTLFDATDPAHPTRLGYWTLPGRLIIPEGLMFSLHNFDVQDGRIYEASYHGGVWVIDIHDAQLLEHPQAIAYAQVAMPRDPSPAYAPEFWSAFACGAFICASDVDSGLQVLKLKV
ncbi:MAG: hypothetical protein LC624_10585 [Halobacteriales archaeon]|nr:hypothetical protein [Halobacteriales archaeon]